jgi:serine protease Do/serine protease DegQ
VGPAGGNVGIGFAIPINVAQYIMQQLVQFGEVRRGVLGISSSDDVTAELAKALDINQSSGVIVNRVSENSAADKAGVQMYDIIVGLNGKPIRHRVDLNNQLGLLPIDSTVTLDIVRDNHPLKLTAKLNAKQERINGKSVHELLDGVVLKLKQERGEDAGLEVVSVSKTARAAQFGLSKGDVIVGLGRYRVRSLADFKELAKNARSLPLNIVRQDDSYLIVIK